eukprot:6439242-Prymnesium_polylepis.1
MNRDTNRPFSRFEWKRIVKRMHRNYYGVTPTGVEIFDWAEIAYSILVKLRQKSRRIWRRVTETIYGGA